MRPAVSVSGRPDPPQRSWISSAATDTAVSSGVRAPRSRPIGDRTRAGYIGAMGSRRTHEDRLARLREAGLAEGELARLRSPIGLDLGARTPEETAVSVAAELIQLRWGGSGRPLTDTAGRIHSR